MVSLFFCASQQQHQLMRPCWKKSLKIIIYLGHEKTTTCAYKQQQRKHPGGPICKLQQPKFYLSLTFYSVSSLMIIAKQYERSIVVFWLFKWFLVSQITTISTASQASLWLPLVARPSLQLFEVVSSLSLFGVSLFAHQTGNSTTEFRHLRRKSGASQAYSCQPLLGPALAAMSLRAEQLQSSGCNERKLTLWTEFQSVVSV